MNLEKRLSSYPADRSPKNRPAFVGGMLAATGAAIFSLPGHANATIIYSGPLTDTASWNNSRTANNFSNRILNIGGGSFQFGGSHKLGFDGQSGGVHLTPYRFSDSVAFVGARSAKKLAKGSSVNSLLKFTNGNSKGALRSILASGILVYGSWSSGQPAYAGVKINGDYGWIELVYTTTGKTASNSPFPGSLEVLGWAYQNDGSAIAAGAVPPPGVSAVPEAGNTATALLLLACAGASLKTWKKRKRATA
jgi:hypothetical protein